MIPQKRLQGRLQEELTAQLNVPGAAAAVVEGDTYIQATTGVVNVETGYPVLPDTWFAVGSITKVYTATLVMMLVAEGSVDLDASVQSIVDDFALTDAAVSEQVTVRMLLTHMSGLPGNFMLDLPKGPDMVRDQVRRLVEFDFNSRPGRAVVLFQYGTRDAWPDRRGCDTADVGPGSDHDAA